MARVFHLTLGSIEKFAVADDYEEMYEKRAEIDPTFAYTPVEIKNCVWKDMKSKRKRKCRSRK